MTPIYVYECVECGERVEELRPMSRRDALADCDHCGKNRCEPVMTTPGSIKFGVGVRGHYNTQADGEGTRC